MFDQLWSGVSGVARQAASTIADGAGHIQSTVGDAANLTTGVVSNALGLVEVGAGQARAGLKAISSKATAPSAPPRRTVFVIHGRDFGAWEAMRDFLELLQLSPENFSVLQKSDELGASYSVQDVLRLAFQRAHALIALFTPDEHAVLHNELRLPQDVMEPSNISRGQPRPNVFFEAGMAYSKRRQQTVMVTFGNVGWLSDLRGVEPVAFRRDDAATREQLTARLRAAGVQVREPGDKRHLEPGTFQEVLNKIERRLPFVL